MNTRNSAKRILLILAVAALAAVQGSRALLAGSAERSEQLQLVCSGDSGNNCGGGPG